jgi:ankyrin repeat protein
MGLFDFLKKGDASRKARIRELCAAAERGHLSAVRSALDVGVDELNEDGGTALHVAAWHGQLDVIRLLLSERATIDKPAARTGSTPLHWAVQNGQAAAARLLRERGANVRAKNTQGVTPWDQADTTAMRDALDPSHIGRIQGGLVSPLAKAADVGANAKAGDKPSAEAPRKANRDAQVRMLCAAAERGDLSGVRSALVVGVDELNEDGGTALHVAAWHGQLEVIRLLLSSNAKVNKPAAKTASTPLHWAVQNGQVAAARLLREHGANIRAKNAQNVTPLDQAAGSPDMLIALEPSGPAAKAAEARAAAEKKTAVDARVAAEKAKIDALCKANKEAQVRTLCAAAQRGDLSAVRSALFVGVDAVNEDGGTALHVAAWHGQLDVIRLLLSERATLNKPAAKTASTPLHWAVQNGQVAAARLLRERGANIRAKNTQGVTPWEQAGASVEMQIALDPACPAAKAAQAKVAAEEARKAAEVKAAAEKKAGEEARKAAEAKAAADKKAAEEAAARNSAVPAEIGAWLAGLKLSEYAARLVSTYRIAFLADFRHLDKPSLVKDCGLTLAEAGRLVDAAAHLPTGFTTRLKPVGPPATVLTVRALVIGINNYKAVKRDADGVIVPGSGPGKLDNAIADAKAVHAALSALPGAASTLLEDCTKAALEQALKDFRDSTGVCKERGMVVKASADASAAASPTLGVVFFAGHGISLNNANYLVPVDWCIPNANRDVKLMEEDAAGTCVGLDTIERMLQRTSMFAGAVLLDCCRDVPDFKLLADREAVKSRAVPACRAVLSGLSLPTTLLDDLLVMFATAPGSTAADKSTRMPAHSPFTAALLKTLSIPNLPLRELNEKLKDEVKADTGGQQIPYVGGSISSRAGGSILTCV